LFDAQTTFLLYHRLGETGKSKSFDLVNIRLGWYILSAVFENKLRKSK